MIFPVRVLNSRESFLSVCAQLTQFGQVGHERIQLIKVGEEYSLSTVPAAGWIEKILSFFGFKQRNLIATEVSHFALHWLRAHALVYQDEFCEQIPVFEKLRSLMIKTHLVQDFDQTIKSIQASYEKTAENIRKLANEIEKKHIAELKVVEGKISESKRKQGDLEGRIATLKLGLSLNKKIPSTTDFVLKWPQNYSPPGNLENLIQGIAMHFLSCPGTIIRRDRKSSNIMLMSPGEGPSVYSLPEKVDFELTGLISRRRIIVKTKEIIGCGGQRKVKRAFDLLSGEELASKPFCSDLEKSFVITYCLRNKTPGFLPCVALRGSTRFYEQKCESISSVYGMPVEIRMQLAQQLLFGLSFLHDQKATITLTKPIEQGLRSRSSNEAKYENVFMYHGDIKPQNILIFQNEGVLQAGISDLGTIVSLPNMVHSCFFQSPEKISFIKDMLPDHSIPQFALKFLQRNQIDKTIEHNLKFGRKNDLWSLGLVFATLLSGGLVFPQGGLEMGIPDLYFFNEILKSRLATREFPDIGISILTQDMVDSSIGLLKNRSMSAVENVKLDLFWDITRLLLSVDPQKRISAKEALKVIE